MMCCFPYPFYIKPQPFVKNVFCHLCCFPYPFYIKPQLASVITINHEVVSHIRSTSNHNLVSFSKLKVRLFPISVLHQTTTETGTLLLHIPLFPISVLHQTTTAGWRPHYGILLFPISVLHQTTTHACISPDYQRYIPEISLQKQRKWLEKYVKDLKKFQLPWTGLQFFLNLALEVQDIPVLFVGNTHN